MEASVRSLFIIGLIILTIINQTSTKSGQCGRPLGTEFLLENDRIVAGYDVGYYRYPWYAALLRYGEVVCGAALVGPKTVVTAAHCYKEYLDIANKGGISLESLYTVKLGVYNICSTEKTEREFKIAKVHVHELYSSRHPYFDICVLTLENDTSTYQPICLPNKNVAQGGDIMRPKEGTVPGLGTLKYHGALPCTVHEARILIYSDLECRQMINRTGNNVSAITNSFCAGYLQGGIDTCQGDSGGPLQVMNENGDYVLLGVVSFGFHCAMPGLLGMYTDVSKYVDWIYDKSGLNSETAITQKVPKSTTALVHVPTKSKPTHPPSYMRPIQVIILHKKRLVVMKKNVLHYPINRH